MEYTLDTVVNFQVSTGFVGCSREQKLTLHELGFDQTELDESTVQQIEDDIQMYFNEWLMQYDIGWSVVE